MKFIVSLLLLLTVCGLPAAAQPADAVLANLVTDRQKADTLYALAMKHFYRDRFDSAALLLARGIPYAEKTGDNDFIANYHLSLGNSYILREEPATGLLHLKNAAPWLAKTTAYEPHMKYLVFHGMSFGKLHNIDSALYYYHQAEQLNNREMPYKNWVVYAEIARLFQHADNYPEADHYFVKAYELTKSKGIRMDYGIMLYRFANFCYASGNAKKFSALVEEQKQFVLSGKRDYTKDPPVHRMLFNDWKQQPFEKKVAFMENVKKELLKEGALSNAALANIYLAEFYEQENQAATALTYALENKRLLENDRELTNTYTNEKLLYRLLKKTGKTTEAVATADRLFALKDSLIRMQQRETMSELETKYETAKKEKDIALLNAENRLSALKLSRELAVKKSLQLENSFKDSAVASERSFSSLLLRENNNKKAQLQTELALKAAITRENAAGIQELARQKKVRWQLIMAAALLLLSGITIFFMYRKQRLKNKLIQQQSDDLKVLMKEIHHRVKNNLQIISSLLDIQSLSLAGNYPAAQAIREGKNRVQSMAIIHQFLYHENNIRGIRIEDYIKNLSENLFASYNINPGSIRLETDIDRLNLDIDTVIPLGLIINELVSNSLKYAFSDISRGILQISLKEKENTLQLLVKDNGRGFPPASIPPERQSFGLQLIAAFAQKLKASLTMYNDNGAVVAMQIKKYKLA